MKPTNERQDAYQRVTDQIVAALEAGARGQDWRMPWHTTADCPFSPINVTSHKAYRGVNVLSLACTAAARSYTQGIWGTYNQWLEKGAQVRKGEKATFVVFWKFFDVKGRPDETQDGDGDANPTTRQYPMVRGYSVFNASQVDGYTPPATVPEPKEARINGAEAFFAALQAQIQHGGNRARYSPTSDRIQMPNFEQFDEAACYYSTLAHECTHWTGHATRCNRDLQPRFHRMAYAAEELVAELGAAFICGSLGIENEPRIDHAQYLASWLTVLENDKRAIFTAASKAQTAADWMHARQVGTKAEAA